ncbi:pyrroline-5-carboxylate reductase [Horticoccus luteus]|uniref:Pyrroline-5-carboxylate reductase n=1 Tax=Horticoccus luteus TaxID=2862869 RepID=A0A8F9XH06_9BACT|nr:pyrroline-5-carboxylate reductase [Horticoccus luteus]QYM79807.1 pyrroline-5-carboxylate reductase [Horticoccus luteus]
MPRFAFLGAGNLAGAMVDGLLENKVVPPADLICLGGPGVSAARLAARTGIRCARSIDDLLADADTLVVAFKPQHLAGADPRLAELTSDRLVISVLAGKRLERLAGVFPHARNVVRAMPNTPAAIGAGMTGWCALRPPATTDATLIDRLLQAMGRAVAVEESQMDAITALGGSGPGFFFEFVAALRDAGVAAGLTSDLATTFAAETTLGAARLLARRQIDPETLRDQVTSPNGTTFAGLQQLKAHDFRATVRAAVLAAADRSRELAQQS